MYATSQVDSSVDFKTASTGEQAAQVLQSHLITGVATPGLPMVYLWRLGLGDYVPLR